MRICAIVPAAGRGVRISSPRLPAFCKETKPFLSVGGTPIITRTLLCLSAIKEIREIIVVLLPSAERYFNKFIRRQLKFTQKLRVVSGGRTRAESVRNGFRKVSSSFEYVLVHDCARPFVRREVIKKLIRSMDRADGVVLAKPVTPTIKRVNGRGLILNTVDRSMLWEAETPQLFKYSSLSRAYKSLGNSKLLATDEASLVEQAGGRLKVVKDQFFNLKITTQADLELAHRYARGEAGSRRIGLGFDIHRLVRRRALYLGGVRIKSTYGAEGYSDADCLIHAICDGMLGALSCKDIGEHFPDSDPRYRGIRSTKLLTHVLSMVRDKGFYVANIDCNIVLERPKLKDYKRKIRRKLSKIMEIPESRISVKAKTSEGMGPVGRLEAVIAHALVHLERDGEK